MKRRYYSVRYPEYVSTCVSGSAFSFSVFSLVRSTACSFVFRRPAIKLVCCFCKYNIIYQKLLYFLLNRRHTYKSRFLNEPKWKGTYEAWTGYWIRPSSQVINRSPVVGHLVRLTSFFLIVVVMTTRFKNIFNNLFIQCYRYLSIERGRSAGFAGERVSHFKLWLYYQRRVTRQERQDTTHAAASADLLEAALEPGADGLLGDLLLDEELELLARQQLLHLQRLADVHGAVR